VKSKCSDSLSHACISLTQRGPVPQSTVGVFSEDTCAQHDAKSLLRIDNHEKSKRNCHFSQVIPAQREEFVMLEKRDNQPDRDGITIEDVETPMEHNL